MATKPSVLCSSRAGYIKYTVPLNLTKYMSKEDEYVPLAAVNSGMGYISGILPQSSPATKYLEVSSHANALFPSQVNCQLSGAPSNCFLFSDTNFLVPLKMQFLDILKYSGQPKKCFQCI